MKRICFILATFLVAARSVAAAPPATNPCPGPIESITDPAPVDVDKLLGTVGALKTANGQKALEVSPAIAQGVRDTFNLALVKTKMEQFYRLLHVIQAGISKSAGKRTPLDSLDVRKMLIASGVFSDAKTPAQISGVDVDRRDPEQPKYEVRFKTDKTTVALNHGAGFFGWESGRCQQTKALIFRPSFSFTLRLRKNGNLVAQNFSGVDLFGDFGSRGLFDVDVEYISLRSVEFYKGTKLGKVTAYVSPEEFKKNDHNPILRVITKFVGDSAVQPIDW
ncbi:MAG TPA: hypothetical protein VI895_01195 [Bdellovibrionota bacterium]|nr:hypothetical protein [Bdellovibrionota bacterium]